MTFFTLYLRIIKAFSLSIVIVILFNFQYLLASNDSTTQLSNAAILKQTDANKSWGNIKNTATRLLQNGYFPIIVQYQNQELKIGYIPPLALSVQKKPYIQKDNLKDKAWQLFSDKNGDPYMILVRVIDETSLIEFKNYLKKDKIKNIYVLISISDHIKLHTIFQYIEIIDKYLKPRCVSFTNEK